MAPRHILLWVILGGAVCSSVRLPQGLALSPLRIWCGPGLAVVSVCRVEMTFGAWL